MNGAGMVGDVCDACAGVLPRIFCVCGDGRRLCRFCAGIEASFYSITVNVAEAQRKLTMQLAAMVAADGQPPAQSDFNERWTSLPPGDRS